MKQIKLPCFKKLYYSSDYGDIDNIVLRQFIIIGALYPIIMNAI